MAEWSEHWTCNSEALSSSPTLIGVLAELCDGSPEFKSSAMLVDVNSELVCLWPVGILNPV